MKRHWILRVVLITIFAALVFSAIVMILWNWLIPALFNGPTISLWQALGLLALSKILFGGLGSGRWGGGHQIRNRAWRKKFEEKWAHMTPEEKEKFKQNFSGCWSKQSKTAKETVLQKA